MQLDCFRLRADAPPLAPAQARRDWMDRSGQRFAYRCLPLTMANASGWELRLPADVTVRWNGKTDRKAITISGYDPKWPVRSYVQSHFGEGVVTFTTGYLFRTSPGVAVWTSGPPNEPRDGIAPLTGLVETDWLPFPFTMNWKFTRPGEVVFRKGEVFCFLTLVEHGRLETITPTLQDIGAVPELEREYRAWSDSRADFIARLEEREPEAMRTAWQRYYMKGETPEGRQASEHVTSRKLKTPDDR
jgi:hypothetical protein